MRDGFVIDLNGEIGRAAGDGIARSTGEFEDSLVVAVDAKLGAARQHAIAFHAVDGLPADVRVYRDEAGAAIFCAADHGLAPVASCVDDGFDVVRFRNGFHRFHTRQTRAGEQLTHRLNALALGRLKGNKTLKRGGRQIEAVD